MNKKLFRKMSLNLSLLSVFQLVKHLKKFIYLDDYGICALNN